MSRFNYKNYIIVVLITSLWVNASEVFRYFMLVMPAMIETYAHTGKAVAEMNVTIFSIWGLWDTILTGLLVFIVWLYTQVFGYSVRSVLKSSTVVWVSIFVIFWIATANMGLSTWKILLITLPLSWLEMFVGGWIAYRLFNTRFSMNR